MDDIQNKFRATFILHALGDTIGYKNGEWEFNYYNNLADYRTTLDIVFDFISLGGITDIDLKDWKVSDDTLFHIAICKALLKDKISNEDVKQILKETVDEIAIDESNKIFRGIGLTTFKSLTEDKYSIAYSGGNGVAMRSLCIGLAFNKKEDINKLIKFSIETGKITHKNPIGFLGGLSTAYFTHLAINKIPIEKWCKKLIDLVELKK